MASRTLTVFLVDLKGYTQRTASSSREEITKLLRSYRKLITPAVGRYGGRIVKKIGDAFLVTFESPTNAVIAGALLQDTLHKRNRSSPERERIEVRIAIHSGEVQELEGDVFGDAVNTAYRLEEVTKIGEVYFTESVYLTMNRNEIPSRKVGERALEGLSQPVRIYRVVQDSTNAHYRKLVTTTASRRRVTRTGRRRWVLPALLLVLTGGGAAAYYFYFRQPDPEVKRARGLVERGRCVEAVDALGRAFQERPPPRSALALVREAADRAIQMRMAAAKDFAAARELAARWAQRWPALQSLPVRVALAESAHHVAEGREEEGAETLRKALQARSESWELHFALSRLYARPGRPEVHIASVDELEKAITLRGSGRRLPQDLKEEIWKRFASQPRQLDPETEKRARTLCSLAHRHLWPEYRRHLAAGAVSDDDALRLNSFTVLTWAGATDSVDLMAYHIRNIVLRWPEKQLEAVAFLGARVEAGERAEALEALRAAATVLAERKDLGSRDILKKIKAAIARLETPAEEKSDSPDGAKPRPGEGRREP